MTSWLEAHSPGWPIFLSTIVVLSVAAAVASARGRRAHIPWWWLAAWLGGIAAFYVTTHLDRQRIGWPRMWGGQLLTIAVTVALPLVAVVAVLSLWGRRRVPGRWALGSGVAAAVGAVVMLLAGSISLWMFGLLQRWIMAGRR